MSKPEQFTRAEEIEAESILVQARLFGWLSALCLAAAPFVLAAAGLNVAVWLIVAAWGFRKARPEPRPELLAKAKRLGP
jgi:hypothetical protein